MTWRRIAPWLIIVIAVLAIYYDAPRKTLGLYNAATNSSTLPAPGLGGEAHTVLGLDLQGGIRVTLKVNPQPGQVVSDDDVSVARNIIEQRVGGLGVSEPQVRTETNGSGDRLIVVEVPGVSNVEEVRKLVGSTGQLQFIDPMQETLSIGQDITGLLAEGKVGVIFNGGSINAGSVAPRFEQRRTRRELQPEGPGEQGLVHVHDQPRQPARPGGPRRQDHHHAEHPERDLPGHHDHHRGHRDQRRGGADDALQPAALRRPAGGPPGDRLRQRGARPWAAGS